MSNQANNQQPTPTKSVDEIIDKCEFDLFPTYHSTAQSVVTAIVNRRDIIKRAIKEATAAETARADYAESEAIKFSSEIGSLYLKQDELQSQLLAEKKRAKEADDRVKYLTETGQGYERLIAELRDKRDTLQRQLREHPIQGAHLDCLAGKLTTFDSICGYVSQLEMQLLELKAAGDEVKKETMVIGVLSSKMLEALANWQEKTKGIK